MKGSDLVLIGLTFLTGVFAGAYLYITVFAPAYGQKPEVVAVDETDFLLSGETYGSCETTDSCASFVLNENRHYEFTALTPGSEEADEVAGSVTADVFTELEETIATTELSAIDRSRTRCVGDSETAAYRYRLIYEREEYFFDTCTDVFRSSALARSFENLWPLVATSSGSTFNLFDDGIGHFLEAEIDKRFQYDEKNNE